MLPYDVVVEHLGTLHTYERWIVALVAFAPFVVLGLVVRSARKRADAEEAAGTGPTRPTGPVGPVKPPQQ